MVTPSQRDEGEYDETADGTSSASARTAVCAWVTEQGAALEQVLPLPVGET